MMKNQTGSAIILGVIVMLFLTIASAGLLPWITNELGIAPRGKELLEAEYAAEAGAKRALVGFQQQDAAPLWGWISYNKYINGVAGAWYNVHLSDENGTVQHPVFNANHDYIIQSTGQVGRAVKTVTLAMNVRVNGVSDVFDRYSLFSNSTMNLNSDSDNPIIKGDIGSNATITAGSKKLMVDGKAYTTTPPSTWQTANWEYSSESAVAKEYLKIDSAGTLDVKSLIPAMPSFTQKGTKLEDPTKASATQDLSGDAYYYDNNYVTSKILNLTGEKVVIYIDGNLKLTTVGTNNASIIGKNSDVTIYVTGNFEMTESTSVQANKLKIYTKGKISLSKSAAIAAEDLTIQTTSTDNASIAFANDSSINKDSTTAVSKIYTKGGVKFTNDFKIIDGKACLVVALGPIVIDSSVNAPNTIFVSDSGESKITNNTKIGGMYTNGKLGVSGTPTIGFDTPAKKTAVLQALGLNGGAGAARVEIGAWSVK